MSTSTGTRGITAATGGIAARHSEALAACAALGLHYWCEAPDPDCVWAVDDNQRSHLVRVDATGKTATLVGAGIGRGDRRRREQPLSQTASVPYSVPGDSDRSMSLFGDVPEPLAKGA